MPKKTGRGLGKGIDSLIPKVNEPISEVKQDEAPKKPENIIDISDAVVRVSITKVEPNREQPRKNFKEEALNELSDSIKEHGVIEPLLVQDCGDYYEIVAGERRWRAARMAGLKEVPVIVKNYTKQEIVEVSLIENIQREDLNPIEEAMVYKRLLTEFNLKQEEIAKRVSKNRTTITNSMRLLNLADEVQQYLIDGSITSGHARSLLSIEDKTKQAEIAKRVISEKMSVRDIEKLVKNLDKPEKKKVATPEVLLLLYKDIEEKLRARLGTKVNVSSKEDGKGKIEIEYYSQEELENIVAAIVE